MSDTPMRLQRTRRKGSRLVSPDGRTVVCCTRPSNWGNPFRVGEHFQIGNPGTLGGWMYLQSFKPNSSFHTIENVAESIEWYRRYVTAWKVNAIRAELTDKHLACYCKLCEKHANGKPLDIDCPDCQPCHVDVIGRILYPKRLESK